MVNNGALIRNYTLSLAGIKSKADKQCKLEQLCGEIGLVYKKGNNFSSGHIEYSDQSAEKYLNPKLLALVELLSSCHLEINIKNYTSANLLNQVTQKLQSIFPEFSSPKINNLTDNILGLMTHRKDGRWYKFESSLSSYPRHAALLISFLEKKACIKGYPANPNKSLSNLGNIDSDQRDQFLESFCKFGLILSKEKIPGNPKNSSALLNKYITGKIEDTKDPSHTVKTPILYHTLEIVEQHVKNNNIKTLYNNIKSFNAQFYKLCDKLDTNFFNDIVRKLTNLCIISFIYDNENHKGSHHNEFIDLIRELFIICLMNSEKLDRSTWHHLNLSIISFREITLDAKENSYYDEKESRYMPYSHKLLPFYFAFREEKYNNRSKESEKRLDEYSLNYVIK